MNKSSRIIDACGTFLNEHAPDFVATELAMPFPNSALHEKTVEELKNELLEARRVQHLLPQFSAKETAHFAYVDEATAIITYKQLSEGHGAEARAHAFTNVATSQKIIKDAQSALDAGGDNMWPGPKAGLKRIITVHKKHIAKAQAGTNESEQLDELSKDKLLNYTRAAASDMQIQGMRQGSASVSAANSENPLVKQDKKDQEKTAAKKASKRFGGILKATRRLATEDTEQLDELSKDTLGSYVEKSSEDGDVKAGREQGVTKAAYRTQGLSHKPGSVGQFKKYKTDDVKTESAEPLDELSVKTLKNYKEKASDAVGSYKYGSKSPTMDIGTVNKRVKGFVKAGAKLSDRIKAATTLIKSNESVEQLDEAYRGKHPEKINSVSGAGEKGAVHVTLNNGSKHKIYAKDTNGAMPAVGDHISKYVSKPLVTEDAVNEARGPLKDHPYHTKSDSELHFIIKDAGEAAKAMKDHSPKSEAKYLDQVNDASTVLHYRKNGGKQLPKETTKPSTVIESFDNNSARNRIKNLLG